MLGEFYKNSVIIQPESKQKMAELDEELVRSLATQRIFARLQESSVARLLPAHATPSPSGPSYGVKP